MSQKDRREIYHRILEVVLCVIKINERHYYNVLNKAITETANHQ